MRVSCLLCVLYGLLAVLILCIGSSQAMAESPFEKENLVAWCIVPFDDRDRTPEERAEMLEKLGIRRLAYDYRAQHVPTFDAELEALKKHNIELTAWWFPGSLTSEAKHILDVLKRHNVQTQLWVTGSGGATSSAEEQAARVKAEADRLRPIAMAAAEAGCTVGLYNHGGWFGEPENQIAIIKALDLPNVGIVYNQHHGHGHVDRFPELLELMKPHLYCLNLNGMVRDGDQKGQKIVPLGAGELDLELLKVVQKSGYTGPIGILNHTQENAEHRLQDNLDGLQWLVAQFDGSAPGPPPEYRTWKRPVADAVTPGNRRASQIGGVLLEGAAEYRQRPLTVECVAQLARKDDYNILVACDTKQSGAHWELFTMRGNGKLTAYLPGYQPDHVHSDRDITDGRTHTLRMAMTADRVRLFVDDTQVADQVVKQTSRSEVPGGLGIGRLVEGTLHCYGKISSVSLSSGDQNLLTWIPEEPKPAAALFPGPYSESLVSLELEAARKNGDALRGAGVFASSKFACVNCHAIGEQGGSVGPELTAIARKQPVEYLVGSVLWPRHKVAAEFVAHAVLTDDGRSLQGYRVSETDDLLVLRDPATRIQTDIPIDSIEDRREVGTLMPEGLAAAMSEEQRRDLFRFLVSLKDADEDMLKDVARLIQKSQVHAPEPFEYAKAPLSPEHWPSAGLPVNRDRIYDFYMKEANYFRGHTPKSPLLPAFPGLDGGQQGHWGNQNEGTWADDRWNNVKLGPFQAGVFHGAGKTVKRGVCVRLGEGGQFAAVFDPMTWSYPVVWKTKGPEYVKFSGVRHGFMHGLIMNGDAVNAEGSRPPDNAKLATYRGFYRFGDRTIFAYDLDGTLWFDAAWVGDDGNFSREVRPVEQHSLKAALRGGPRQWDWSWKAEGTRGNQQPFAVDMIPMPVENPWNALLFCGGHDFLRDSSALVCTMHGDVWRVSGLDEELKQVTWTRYASGLHHALGMVIDRDDASTPEDVYLQCRDQLTRLHDLNGDGEADFYECFSNAFETSPAGHDFICGLQRDPQGRFYTASGNQGVLRISADGQSAEVLATGFRNPDGLGLTQDGLLTVPCSEGDWTPASQICAISTEDTARPYFGYGGPRNGAAPSLPLAYLPRGLDNSSGGQAAIPTNTWPGQEGNLVHLSFGQGSGFLLLRDEVRGQMQGAIMPMQTEFLSGAHRGRFSPQDGHLYVSGMAGWGCYTPDDGCFQRVRYNASSPLPSGFHVHENGIVVEFDRPVQATSSLQPFAHCWNYRYGGGYGSPELSPSHPGTPGHDVVEVTSTHVLADGRSVFFEMPDLQPVNQLHLSWDMTLEQRQELVVTVHALDAPLTGYPGYQHRQKTIAAHPILADIILATRSIPNPWLKRNHQARKIMLETAGNLTFATRTLTAKPGEAIALTLRNPDVVPHNWALIKPGTLATVGEASNRLIADPEAALHQYVPDLDAVICYTDIVSPGGEFTIWIKAPNEPGRYPYLCTFPGHWMVMNGELVVAP